MSDLLPLNARSLRFVAAAAVVSGASVPAQAPPSGARAASRLEWHGADSIAWSWSGGTPRTDWITRVIEVQDGGIVAVGFVNRDDSGGPSDWDAVAMKLAADGRVLWSKQFGGAGLDAFWDVREGTGGRLVVAGFSSSSGAGGNDAWLVMLDSAGVQLAERRFGGARDDLALGVALASDGGAVLVGQTQSMGEGERDVFVVRTDDSGREIWRKSYGGPGVDRGFYIERAAGGFVLAGVTGQENNYDMLVMRLDDAGDVVWRRTIGGEGNDPNHGLRMLPDGRVLVAGYTQSWGATVHDLVAVLLSPDGEVLRHEVMGGPGDDRVMQALPDRDGGTWFVGYTRRAADWDILIARVRPDGSFEPWLGAVGRAGDDHAYSGTVAATRDIVLGGYTSATPGGAAPPDLLVLRLGAARLIRNGAGIHMRRIR